MRSLRKNDGCGFLIGTCIFTCVFLIINGALVISFYSWAVQVGPDHLRHPKVAQAMMFIGPIVLIVVEWWLVDLIVLRVPSRRVKSKKGGD